MAAKPIVVTSKLKYLFSINVIPLDDKEACWLWRGTCNVKSGYGVLKCDGVLYLAHRLSYVLHYKPIDFTLHVLHDCDNPPCVNPHHLDPGTDQDNHDHMVLRDRQSKGESRPAAKLNDELVRYIRREARLGKTVTSLAAELQVAKSQISDVINRKSWKHVKD